MSKKSSMNYDTLEQNKHRLSYKKTKEKEHVNLFGNVY